MMPRPSTFCQLVVAQTRRVLRTPYTSHIKHRQIRPEAAVDEAGDEAGRVGEEEV